MRPASTSPVLTPTLSSGSIPKRAPSSSRRPAIAACIPSAARTARAGSSSWACGAPNTAITLSPMNLSTRPPKRSTSAASRVRQRSTSAFTVSWSRRSEIDVNPERSANRTVTVRRSSASGGAAPARALCAAGSPAPPSAAPQPPQKFAPAGACVPHAEQALTSGEPQDMQNDAPAGFGAAQAPQTIWSPIKEIVPGMRRALPARARPRGAQRSSGTPTSS